MSLVAARLSFLDLPPEDADLKTAKAVIASVPYEATTSYGCGTKDGPRAILEASRQVELYDEELDASPYEVGIATLEPLHIDRSSYEAPIRQTQGLVAAILDKGQFPVVLGGEHSLTFGAVEAAHARHGDLSILQIDAHADLRDTYEESPWSHACVMRRVVESGVPAVQVGIRNISEDEMNWVREAKPATRIIWGHEIPQKGIDAVVQDVLSRLSGKVWITIDVDGLDPSIMPATGTPEPGGLGWYDTLKLLRQVFANKDVVGCDVVELAPAPGLHHPNFLTARLVYKLIGYRFHGAR